MPEGLLALTERDVEDVTVFVQRYCAVETSTDEIPNGYFAFRQGPSARKAAKARAPVKWGALESTISEVLRRVRELASNGEGNVYLWAYHDSDKSPIETLKIQGSNEELDNNDEPEDRGSAIAALVHGIVRTNSQLLAENREHRDRAWRQQDNQLEDRERMTMLAVHGALMEQAGSDQAMAAALQALGPTIEALTPKVVEVIARYMSGRGAPIGPELPSEPGPRIEALVGRLKDTAAELGPVCVANPAEVTVARVAPLYELIRQLAGPLGLTVTGYPVGGAA